MTTTNMLLTVPTIAVTLDPTWAQNLNDDLDLIDAHDHTSGKGARITPAAFNINDDIAMGSNSVIGLRGVQFTNLSANPASPYNTYDLSWVNGNLVAFNGAGVAIPITAGNTLNFSDVSVNTFETHLVTSNVAINASDTYVYLLVHTNASRSISLPAASSVVAGRSYVIKDVTGGAKTNNITINRDGSDTIEGAASSYVIDRNSVGLWITSDGISNWSILETSTHLINQGTYSDVRSLALVAGTLSVDFGSTVSIVGGIQYQSGCQIFGDPGAAWQGNFNYFGGALTFDTDSSIVMENGAVLGIANGAALTTFAGSTSTFGGAITASGTSAFSGTQNISGTTNISGTAAISATTTLSGATTVTSAVTLSGAGHINKRVYYFTNTNENKGVNDADIIWIANGVLSTNRNLILANTGAVVGSTMRVFANQTAFTVTLLNADSSNVQSGSTPANVTLNNSVSGAWKWVDAMWSGSNAWIITGGHLNP